MHRHPAMLGISAAVRALEADIDCAARSTAKVLVTGESGVGKEVVAHLIHDRSARRAAPLVAVNCAGIPDSLLESELFGHVRGSFTDAYRDKAGWLERAAGGTAFLDEIGEMSLRMQALLLRFLETGELQRVGDDRDTRPIDVRVIAATHRHLGDMIADRAFREDLYYRLNVIHIAVPPLRERREDVPVLLKHFLRLAADAHAVPLPGLSGDALAALIGYHWPGNVRELRNVTERLVLRGGDALIDVDDLPHEVLTDQRGGDESALTPAAARRVDALFDRIVNDGESFWSVVYEPFMARDLTRREIRDVVRLGLERTRGNYKVLVGMFNLGAGDYKKFLNFLRKYQCQVPFQTFRAAPVAGDARPAHIVSA